MKGSASLQRSKVGSGEVTYVTSTWGSAPWAVKHSVSRLPGTVTGKCWFQTEIMWSNQKLCEFLHLNSKHRFIYINLILFKSKKKKTWTWRQVEPTTPGGVTAEVWSHPGASSAKRTNQRQLCLLLKCVLFALLPFVYNQAKSEENANVKMIVSRVKSHLWVCTTCSSGLSMKHGNTERAAASASCFRASVWLRNYSLDFTSLLITDNTD